jgi:hypothetical protein
MACPHRFGVIGWCQAENRRLRPRLAKQKSERFAGVVCGQDTMACSKCLSL